MGSVCAEQHKFHLFSPRKKGGLDIPPRKLIGRPNATAGASSSESTAATDTFLDSLKGLEKFLPSNGGSGIGGSDSDDSSSDDPYSSDHFRMYVFKVRRCTRSRSHDWTDCPFAHPGEKAQRRDPRRFHYSGTVCSEFRRGSCSRGDNCEFAHGVFESWLHPSRYRTEACKDGKNCKRKVCFFAHSQRELRILPLQADNYPTDPTDQGMYQSSAASSAGHQLSGRCCLFCHQPSMASSSPTSTLMALSHLSSPPVSPPLSPIKHRAAIGGLSPSTRYANRLSDLLSYRDELSEIMGSLDAMKVSDVPSGDSRNKRNVPWVDMSFLGDDQTRFILSPAALSPASMPRDSPPFAGGGLGFFEDYKDNENNGEDRLVAASDPDLGWVNELLI